MPAKAPAASPQIAAALTTPGERISARRERQRVSATDAAEAAEAACMSRVTPHHIERGEPSVTVGHT